jgi:hypothetical protein
MKPKTEDFTLEVDGVKGICPAGEAWAEQQILQKKIPVLACEGPCIRGDIARLAANRVAKEEPFARACYAETFLVPHSSMARWVKEADKVVMVDCFFLKCIGRVCLSTTNIRIYSIWRMYPKLSGSIPLSMLQIRFFLA